MLGFEKGINYESNNSCLFDFAEERKHSVARSVGQGK